MKSGILVDGIMHDAISANRMEAEVQHHHQAQAAIPMGSSSHLYARCTHFLQPCALMQPYTLSQRSGAGTEDGKRLAFR